MRQSPVTNLAFLLLSLRAKPRLSQTFLRTVFVCLLLFAVASVDAAPPRGTLTPVTADSLLSIVRSSDAKIVLVNFWSTWCDPCREEMPGLVQLQQTLQNQKLKVIFVSMDFEAQADAALDTLTKKGASLPSYIKRQKDDPFIRAIHADWSGALPATFIYDAQGTLLTWWNQARTFKQFKQDLLPLLKD